MQQITLVGRLTADAQKRTSKSGDFICFRVATSNMPKRDDSDTAYYDVTSSSLGLLEKLRKGTQVFVSGGLALRLSQEGGRTYLNASVTSRLLEILQSAPSKEEKLEKFLGEKIEY